jgi:hypothetical protein
MPQENFEIVLRTNFKAFYFLACSLHVLFYIIYIISKCINENWCKQVICLTLAK